MFHDRALVTCHMEEVLQTLIYPLQGAAGQLLHACISDSQSWFIIHLGSFLDFGNGISCPHQNVTILEPAVHGGRFHLDHTRHCKGRLLLTFGRQTIPLNINTTADENEVSGCRYMLLATLSPRSGHISAPAWTQCTCFGVQPSSVSSLYLSNFSMRST